MVQTEEFFMIRELFQKGWLITAISDETGIDPKTIRKYIKSDEIPKRKSRHASSESKLDPYKEYLKTRKKEGTTNFSVLFDEIEGLGYEGKMSIFRDFVRPYRTSPKIQATLRYEFLLVNRLKWIEERLANMK
ncbi:hypothetical protein [Guptibacillus spartinae]|uniref:hypothetical protein n=1 Tax=Guptibacillus spartinae TaxID=3025679 RepID=UPI00235E3E9A|nr:hypothetical protein [Pseudalkalibacillus spartinae]